MLIDTHCHLNLIAKKKFDIPLTSDELNYSKQLVNEIREAGIESMVTVGTNFIESHNCIQIAERNEGVYAAIGVHPQDCKPNWSEELKKITPFIEHSKVVAIGECGLDFHYKPYNAEAQKDLFKAQIELAIRSDLALVIHTWDAFDETISIIEKYINDIPRVVIHCFSESAEAAKHVTAMGCFIGVPASITYPKNEQLRDVVRATALEHIVLETDAPFLPPQSMRGKPNSPKNVLAVANAIADLMGIPFETIANQTTVNAKKLYKI